jgi:hypothetical protein
VRQLSLHQYCTPLTATDTQGSAGTHPSPSHPNTTQVPHPTHNSPSLLPRPVLPAAGTPTRHTSPPPSITYLARGALSVVSARAPRKGWKRRREKSLRILSGGGGRRRRAGCGGGWSSCSSLGRRPPVRSVPYRRAGRARLSAPAERTSRGRRSPSLRRGTRRRARGKPIRRRRATFGALNSPPRPCASCGARGTACDRGGRGSPSPKRERTASRRTGWRVLTTG